MQIIKQLDEWEGIIFHSDNIKDFENKFCHGNELISVCWCSTRTKFVFMTIEGQHICDTVKNEVFFEWLKNRCPHCAQGYVQDAGFVECKS